MIGVGIAVFTTIGLVAGGVAAALVRRS